MGSKISEILLQRLRASPGRRRLLLTEGFEARTIQAATEIAALNVADVELLVPTPRSLPGVRTVLTAEHPSLSRFAEQLAQRRAHKGMTFAEATELLKNPLYLGAAMLQAGEADAAVSGAHNTTADVIRAGIYTLDRAPDIKTISSLFLMTLPDGRTLTYADCGVVAYPSVNELTDIAMAAAQAHATLLQEPARVGFLSFSTLGSATHERIQLVRDAVAQFRQRAPGIPVEGEIQFDAAFVPEVAKRKCPDSRVAGQVNVFIFPNLDAGNIAYKITERIGGATALGPILQGFSRPWLDLSRGCSVADIVGVALVGLASVTPRVSTARSAHKGSADHDLS